MNALEQDGGFLVRRLSGGGAVYHDLSAISTSLFLPGKEVYDVQRQLSVILDAVQAFGLQAVKSGRNDSRDRRTKVFRQCLL